ncbi:hypothetical protein QJS04_geneDACA022759 [Acorus gramineus]|uniref:FAD-binding domain-containing protein n=1 Tax=Acorus gramineus TaxID=55184 RepID=A0AAV9AFB2_ACOGR|nr:hypothetical protein QJS04_geneDACA022759 [Acorus gramineus]
METCEDVVIVGGGLAGLVIAVALKRVGIRSLILERSDELRATGGVITLYPNAWRALEAIGIAHKLTPHYTPFHSVVAKWLGLSAAVQLGHSAVRGVAVIPEGHRFDRVLQQFLDEGTRAVFVPLNDQDLYWGVTHISFPGDYEMMRDPESIQKLVIQNVTKIFPPRYIDVVNHTDLTTLTWAPLMFRYPWDLLIGQPWHGCVTVEEGAMHLT